MRFIGLILMVLGVCGLYYDQKWVLDWIGLTPLTPTKFVVSTVTVVVSYCLVWYGSSLATD